MDARNTHATIEKIYEAALDPSQWRTVLQALQEQLSSDAAGLYRQNAVTHAFESVQLIGFDKVYQDAYRQHFAALNPWFGPERLMRPGLTLTEQSLDAHYNCRDWLTRTEFYNDWMAPQGFQHRMGGTLYADGDTYVNFTFLRSSAAGPFGEEEIRWQRMIGDHLRQALRINKYLENANLALQASATVFDRLRCGLIFLDHRRRVSLANTYAQRLLDERDGLLLSHGTLKAASHEQNGKLEAMIEQALTNTRRTPPPAPARLTISRRGGRRSLTLLAISISRHQSIFASERLAVALFVCDPEHRLRIDKRYLEQRYGLNRHEAGIVRCLSQSRDLRSAAKELGLSYETARWYLKQAFEKTGSHTQADLVRLVLSDFAVHLSSSTVEI